MEIVREKTSGPLENPTNTLLVPPLHAVPRSKTGRKPQRSSPLAGPAVLVSDAEDTLSPLTVPSSPIQGRNPNSLSTPTLRPRPKSMAFDYSTRSLHAQSLTPRSRPHAPGSKQIIRPISSVLPFSATQDHFSNADSSSTRELRNFGERYQNPGIKNTLPLARTSSQRVSPTSSRPPTIVLDGRPIDVDVPEAPSPVRSRARMTETMPRANSWYIASAYDETPKFSRLGLSADNVVLPVSAKEYKKCQQQHQRYSTNSDGSLAKSSSLKKRSSVLMASTLKLASSFTSTPDHQIAQDPSTPSTSSSLSSRTSITFAESYSSPASATSSPSSSPHPSLPRTRTSSLTNSSSSSYTCFIMPDLMTPSSRTSFSEGATEDGKDTQREGTIFSISSGKDQNKRLFASKSKRRTTGQPDFNPESIIICPVVAKDEKKLRRGSVIRKFIRLFVPS